MYPLLRRSMRGTNNQLPVGSTSNSVQRVDIPAKERCYSNEVLKRCFSETHRKHDVLVAQYFRLKFHFQNLCDEFAKSIVDGLNEVGRLCAAKQSLCSKMESSYKKSYVAYMKVHAKYIFGRKIKEIPKKFDTKVARHNMAVKLYRLALEKPKLHLPGEEPL
ncbi:hypothetical protein Fot_35292 [Forsythia ovata]|uniref:Uncharacterized protein n=1 Tax=Forsythia ovata TaxID=205694 RepID=A0ABD1SNV8_9LAMI